MGIRSNNNIKVVKNVIPPTISMSKKDIDKNLTQNFLINLDQLNPADLSRYDVDMVYSEGSLTEKYKMLSSDECDAFDFVYDLAKQNLLPEFNGPIELLNIIYGVLKKNTHGIHVDDATLFSVNPKKLPQILVDMELIKEIYKKLKNYSFKIIKDANHKYKGKEKELGNEIYSFLLTKK